MASPGDELVVRVTAPFPELTFSCKRAVFLGPRHFFTSVLWVFVEGKGFYFLDFWFHLVDIGAGPDILTLRQLCLMLPLFFFSMVLPTSDRWLEWQLFSLGNRFTAQGEYFFLGKGVPFECARGGEFGRSLGLDSSRQFDGVPRFCSNFCHYSLLFSFQFCCIIVR